MHCTLSLQPEDVFYCSHFAEESSLWWFIIPKSPSVGANEGGESIGGVRKGGPLFVFEIYHCSTASLIVASVKAAKRNAG